MYCPKRYHFEPPSIYEYAQLWCQGDGMWTDPAAHTVRRCVRDVLNCTWPLVDLGLEYCQPTQAVVSNVYVSYPFNGSVTLLNRGGVAVAGVPPDYDSTVTLTVRGSLFVHPVRVTVQGQDCQQVTLSEPSQVVCYNDSVSLDRSQPYLVCDQMSVEVTCQLPRLFGSNMDVQITSGRAAERVQINATGSAGTFVSLTSAAPRITLLEATNCQANGPLSLSLCPVNRTFSLTICAASDSVVFLSTVLVTLGSRVPGNCSRFNEQRQAEYCATCNVLPQYGTQPLLLLQSFGVASDSSAALSFDDCPAGSMLDRSSCVVVCHQPLHAVSCGLVYNGQQRPAAVHALPSRHVQRWRRR